jgi:hypothetical protein
MVYLQPFLRENDDLLTIDKKLNGHIKLQNSICEQRHRK